MLKPLGIDWRAARREMRALRENPNDIEAGARLGSALSGEGSARKTLDRMRRSEVGRRILATERPLLPVLMERDRLRALPDGVVGREYVRFADREQIYPEYLQEIVEQAGMSPVEREEAFIHGWGRDLHDVLHLVTGYGRDPVGEIALLAFSGAQGGNRAPMLLSLLGCFKAARIGRFDVLGVWWQALRRARRARFLLAEDWEAMLEQPLDQVRKELGLWPMPIYEPLAIEQLAA